VGINYRSSWAMRPEFTLGFAYGSGDRDRVRVTNTEDGNLKGQDHNFLPFGVYPAGIALSPTLSNILILKVGSTFHPFVNFWRFKDLILGAEAFFYWKFAPKGGIYDIEATRTGVEVGQEFDLSFEWEIISDITLSADYGVFLPGNAFPIETDDLETYLTTSFTFSF